MNLEIVQYSKLKGLLEYFIYDNRDKILFLCPWFSIL